MTAPSGYRFAGFVVSRRRRQVLRDGVPLPLIPRYFDLLVLLIEQRPNVVTRREIFDRVWGEVIVSDGALSQAIRTLRRTLGDDSREPVFIRTVSRHGYSFVFADVLEGDDEIVIEEPRSSSTTAPAASPSADATADRDGSVDMRVAALCQRLLQPGGTGGLTLEDRRDIAAELHALGTERALACLLARPGHAEALALLRDTRWDVAGAGAVPLWGRPEGLAAARHLLKWRARDALRVTSRRWAQAAAGAAAAGAVAGLAGGALLVAAPGSTTPATVMAVLMVLGAAAGFAGAAGVAAGMASAEAVVRSRRGLAMVAGGAAGGAAVGLLAQVLATWTLTAVFGLHVPIGGPLEGFVLGLAVSAGYAVTTRRFEGGIAAPAGWARWATALACAGAAAAAALVLSAAGRPLVGGIVHAIAQASRGSQVALTPLGAWIGDPDFGPVTQALVAASEAALFGLGLAWGLTRRPRGPDA